MCALATTLANECVPMLLQVETDEMIALVCGLAVISFLRSKYGALGSVPIDKLALCPGVLCVAGVMGFGALSLPTPPQ